MTQYYQDPLHRQIKSKTVILHRLQRSPSPNMERINEVTEELAELRRKRQQLKVEKEMTKLEEYNNLHT